MNGHATAATFDCSIYLSRINLLSEGREFKLLFAYERTNLLVDYSAGWQFSQSVQRTNKSAHVQTKDLIKDQPFSPLGMREYEYNGRDNFFYTTTSEDREIAENPGLRRHFTGDFSRRGPN